MEGENPGAIKGMWGDVIFIMCYGVRSDADGGRVWGVTLLVVVVGMCWGWCHWVPDGVDLWCGQGGVVTVEWGTGW